MAQVDPSAPAAPQTPTPQERTRPPQPQGQGGRPPRDGRQQGGPRGEPGSGGGQRGRDQRDRPPRSAKDRNTVFIGNKPPMNYVLAVVTQFNQNEPEVIIRARGKAIAQAVDVAEIVRNKFYSKCSVKQVTIGTEQVTSEDGRRRSVSAIEIRLQNDDAGAKPAPAPAATTASGNLPQAGNAQKGPSEPALPTKSAGV